MNLYQRYLQILNHLRMLKYHGHVFVDLQNYLHKYYHS